MTLSLKTTSVAGFFLLLVVSLTYASNPLSCLSCEGINCLRTSLVKKETCLDPLDVCVTIFNGYEVERKGCSLQIPVGLRRKCDINDGLECHRCNEDNCNTLGRKDNQCVVCDSSNNGDCKTNAAAIAPTRCSSPTSPNAYCFVRIENNQTKRGCAINVKDQQDCFKSANCKLCFSGDVKACNAVNFTPGSYMAYRV